MSASSTASSVDLSMNSQDQLAGPRQSGIGTAPALGLGSCVSLATGGTVVIIETNQGTFKIQLFDSDTPATVQNFLNYVERDDYKGTFFHRSVPGFIVQGGGFKYNSVTGQADPIRQDPPVKNEFKFSNTRGTVAMAKLSGDADSATNQWFVNLANNSGNLDDQNGGFTVFGQVIENGMSVVDAIAALPRVNFGGAFTDVPTVNYNGEVSKDIFVNLTNVILAIDSDEDGIDDSIDDDDDNDGVLDQVDVFPFDPTESADFDGDGVGDNADTDDDGDGVPDEEDAFPRDATESVDTDADGLGNNADLDDDNDGMPDIYELANGLDPLTDDAESDADGDNISNRLEYQTNTDPNDATSFDRCVDQSVVASDATDSLLGQEVRLSFANPGSNIGRQTFLRFINPNSS